MRVLMLTWEFPPRSVGGVAAHVDGLSQALARAGHDVVLFTLSHPGAPADSRVGDVRVLRARTDLPWLPDDELVARVASANHHLVQLSTRLGDWTPHVVHAHDWQVAWAADTLATLHHAKLMATFHSTERGPARRPGAAGPAEHDPRHRVVARPRRRRGRHQLQVHGQRGHQRLRAPRRAHPPDPQRHRPDVVVDRRVARRPHAARVHVGPGPVREGVPGPRPGDAPAAVPGARRSSASSAAAAATSPSCSRRSTSRASATSSTSPASCPTTGCATPSTAPAASPSRRCTSRSASSPSRRSPAGRRSSSPAPAGWPS